MTEPTQDEIEATRTAFRAKGERMARERRERESVALAAIRPRPALSAADGSRNATGKCNAPPLDPLPLVMARAVGRELDTPPQIIEAVACRGEIVLIYGEPESGKSTCGLHMGACGAAGADFLGLRTVQCGVLYVAPEHGGTRQRLHALMHRHNFGDIPLALVPAPIDVSGLPDVERIIEAARTLEARTGSNIGMVFVDTFATAIGASDENSAADMGHVLTHFRFIADTLNAAVLPVHHTGKDATRGGRGSSAIRAAVDAEIEVTHDRNTGLRLLTVRKQRSLGTTGRAFAARFVPLEIGRDQWNEPVTACVIEAADTPEPSARSSKGPRLSAHARNAMAVFQHLLSERGEALATTSICPPGKRGVRLSDWRARYLYQFPPEPSDNPTQAERNREAKRKEFARARDVLVAEHVLGTSGEWMWKS